MLAVDYCSEISRALMAERKLDWELNAMKTIDLTFEVASLNRYKFLTHEDATLYCFSLNINGETGWRLPTEDECIQLQNLWIFYHRTWINRPNTIYDFSNGMCLEKYNGTHLAIPVRDTTRR